MSPPPLNRNYLISFVRKMGAVKVSQGIFKNFIFTQIIAQISKISIQKFAKQFAKESDELIAILEEPWWTSANGFIPVVNNIFELEQVPAPIQQAIQKANVLALKVRKVLSIQGKQAKALIPESLKRVKDYPSELEYLTYAEIVEQAKTSREVAKLKKLIEQEQRLMEKL